MAHRRFLLRFVPATLILLGMVCALHLSSDPYYLFRTELALAPGERFQPELHLHVRQWKAHRLAHGDIAVVLLGSSRVEYGIDPLHPRLRSIGRTFNAGIPGASMMEIAAYGRHAIAANPIKRVILGLDPLMFDSRTRPKPDFDSSRLKLPGNRLFEVHRHLDRLTTVLSHQGTADAITSAIGVDLEAIAYPYYPNGQRHWERQYRTVADAGGVARNFRERGPEQRREFLAADFREGNDAWRSFDELLEALADSGTRVDVFFSPSHAFECMIIASAGQAKAHAMIKRRVMERLDATRSASPGFRFTLTDFSCANAVTSEEVPGDASSRMDRYFDYSHYRTNVGDRVIERIVGGIPDPGFGVVLSPGNIVAVLSEQSEAQAKFASSHPMLQAWLEEDVTALP